MVQLEFPWMTKGKLSFVTTIIKEYKFWLKMVRMCLRLETLDGKNSLLLLAVLVIKTDSSCLTLAITASKCSTRQDNFYINLEEKERKTDSLVDLLVCI